MEFFEKKVRALLKKHIPQEIALSAPPNPLMGDYSLPCFSFAKELKKSPADISKELAAKISAPFLEKVEAQGPYLNFFIGKKALAKHILSEKRERKVSKEKVMIEFSQANTHKAFHVGHIRGTSLGESLARILEHEGYKVTRVNYQGDTGMHVAKWLWCYLKFHAGEKLTKSEAWVASIYVEAVKKLAADPALQEEVDDLNRRLDSKADAELLDIWKKTRALSLDALETIYKELDARFDHYFFESEMEERGREIARQMIKEGIAKVSEAATIMDLKEDGMGIWVLLRKDGTVLYSAKDLALAEIKFKKYRIDRSIYVVGKEQELHFSQLFRTLERMKFPQAKKCVYVPVSLVKLPWGKMSSRTGDNILYSEFKGELLEVARKEVADRFNLEKGEVEKRAQAITLAAMKYSMLKQHPNKEIVFQKEEALKFEGDTGPYLLYSYARASSILRSSKKKPSLASLPSPAPKEIELLKKIASFHEEVEQAARQFNPATLANYSFRLAQSFNEFYAVCQVIGSPEEQFRLAIVEKFQKTLAQALGLLGMTTLEQM